MRAALPHTEAVADQPHVEVLDHEKGGGAGRALAPAFAAGTCSCRHEKLHLGEKRCDTPLEVVPQLRRRGNPGSPGHGLSARPILEAGGERAAGHGEGEEARPERGPTFARTSAFVCLCCSMLLQSSGRHPQVRALPKSPRGPPASLAVPDGGAPAPAAGPALAPARSRPSAMSDPAGAPGDVRVRGGPRWTPASALGAGCAAFSLQGGGRCGWSPARRG